MLIHYEELEVCGEYLSRNQSYGAISPDTEYGTYTISYDYEVVVGETTLRDYLKEECVGIATFNSWSQEKRDGFYNALIYLFECGLLSDEFLEQDEKFMAWAKGYFEEDAQEQCHRDYDD